MAREALSVVFIYDCEGCVSEADDPQDAIVYFYPSWVSEQQRLALCGQLMGATHFFLASFSCPRLICLSNGHFAVRQCGTGRFVLAVGADRASPLLQRRADALAAMLRLFHGGLDEVAAGCDRPLLIARLQDILDTLVPLAHKFGDLFGHQPSLLLPKSASNVFIEAVQVLEFCQSLQGVLGGTVLYDNRVVATQLPAELTRKLIFSDPYHIRNSVETVPAQFELPLGVRLLRIYLEQKEHETLLSAANVSRQVFTNIDRPEKYSRSFGSMVRDMSRIFTVMEEREDEGDRLPELSSPPRMPLRKASVPLDDRWTPPPTRLSLPVGAVTPGTLGKILHAKRLSICAQREVTEEEEQSPQTPEESIFRHSPETKTTSPVQEEEKKAPPKARSRSTEDLTSFRMRGYSFGLPKPIDEKTCSSKTITDPNFPVFRSDGLPVSQSLFEQHLEQNLSLAVQTPSSEKTVAPKKVDFVLPAPASGAPTAAVPPKSLPLAFNKDKKQLTLPLGEEPTSRRKHFVLGREEDPPATTSLFVERVETPSLPRAAITPGARVTTPAEFRSLFLEKRKKELAANMNKSMEESVAIQQDDMAKAVLYTYGYQGMTLMLLLENHTEQDHDLLLNIEEAWLESAPYLESRLRKSLEQTTSADSKESYSFMHLEPEWDALQRGGSWGAAQLSVARQLHSDLSAAPDMTEIIARCEDQIVYGAQYCQQQVFYQQRAAPKVGLPTPADLMGTVPLTAKRRLERDHGILLL